MPALVFPRHHGESHLFDASIFCSLGFHSHNHIASMSRTLKIGSVGLALAISFPAAVNAQSSSGNITGEAAIGDTVTITGVDTGFRRELKIEKDGKYQLRRVPTGDYQVVRVHKDGTMDPVQSVVVRPGGTARVMENGKAESKDIFSGS